MPPFLQAHSCGPLGRAHGGSSLRGSLGMGGDEWVQVQAPILGSPGAHSALQWPPRELEAVYVVCDGGGRLWVCTEVWGGVVQGMCSGLGVSVRVVTLVWVLMWGAYMYLLRCVCVCV